MNAGSVYSEIFSSETQVDTKKNLTFLFIVFIYPHRNSTTSLQSALKRYHLSSID